MPERSKQNMEKLKKELDSLSVPQMPAAMKARVKASLMASLSSKEEVPMTAGMRSLAQKMRSVGSMVMPGLLLKIRVKERVFARMDRRVSWFASRGFLRLLSSALVFTIVTVSFFFFAFDAGVTQAQALTRITSVKGEVFILRGEEHLPAELGMVMRENDKVRTGPGASATIVYHDDSVTRLSENTELSINRLINLSDTQVEVSLANGNVWTNVPALSGKDSSFTLRFADTVAEVSNKATFNVAINDRSDAELEVFQSVVYVADKKGAVEPVINGYKVKLDAEAKPKIARLNDDDKYEAWVKENMFEDQKYVQSVVDKAIVEFKKDGGSENAFADLEAIKEQDAVVADLPLPQRIATSQDNFNSRLADYQILLNQGKKEEAAKYLINIRSLVDTLLADINELENKETAEALRKDLNKSLNLHKKTLTLIAPNDAAEDVLYELEIDIADTEEEKKIIGLKKTTDDLTDAVDLLQKGDLNVLSGNINDSTKLSAEATDDKIARLYEKNESLISILEREKQRKLAVSATSERELEGEVTTVITNRTVEGPEKLRIDDTTTRISNPDREEEQILPPQFHLNFEKDKILE